MELFTKVFFYEFPGIVAWKLRNLQVTILGNFQLPGIVTQKFRNIQSTIPGDFSFSKYPYLEIPSKKHYFHEYIQENENILGYESRAYALLIHEKTRV